jgi:hypothetical protein
MAIGSISSGTVSTALDRKRPDQRTAEPADTAGVSRTVADHVAAADDQEPIRSVSTTRGTLVDTYL